MHSFASAFRDFREGIRLAPIWLSLGWDQTVGRFRRTLLGPFWLASGMLALAVALSFVFGAILGQDWRSTFPSVLLGVMAWTIVGTTIAEATTLFVSAAPLMQLQKLPLTFHVFLHMFRATVNFAAQFVVAIAVLLILGLMPVPHWSVILAIPVVLALSFSLSLIVAIPSTRFRDVANMFQMLVQVLFFCTPIFWSAANIVGPRRAIVDYNPLAHELEIIRRPLMGLVPALTDWAWVLGTLALTTSVAFVMLAVYRRRVVFWL